jgi:hypothetical protein
MPKKKKTRKQKMQSDQRRQTITISAQPIPNHEKIERETPSPTTTVAPTAKPIVRHAILTGEYQYLSGDLLKTAVLTCSIVLAELLIHFFAK